LSERPPAAASNAPSVLPRQTTAGGALILVGPIGRHQWFGPTSRGRRRTLGRTVDRPAV